MACEEQCSYVTWEADRPRLHNWGAVEINCQDKMPEAIPEDLLDQLAAKVMNENSGTTQQGCPNCDCETVGDQVLVLTTEKYRPTTVPWTAGDGTQCTIIATFKLRLRKYRSPGECAPPDLFGT